MGDASHDIQSSCGRFQLNAWSGWPRELGGDDGGMVSSRDVFDLRDGIRDVPRDVHDNDDPHDGRHQTSLHLPWHFHSNTPVHVLILS